MPLSDKLSLGYALKTSPVYVAVFLMRFSFAFTVVALQYVIPSAIERGVISSAYPIMEMLTGLFFGLLADRIGRKWITVGALFASSIVSFSFTITRSFLPLVLIHGLQGVCAAAVITATLASLTDLGKKETRGREMGFYDFCTIGGYGLGFVFALVLIDGNASRSLLPFYAGSAVAVVGALFSLFFLKDAKISLVSQGTSAIASSVRKVLENEKSLTLVATWFVLTMLIGAGLTFTRELTSTLFHSTSIGFLGNSTQPTRIGAVLIALLIAGVVLLGFSQTTLGGLSDRFGRERLVLVGQVSIFGILVLLVLLLAFNLNRIAALPFVFLFGAGLLAFTPSGLAELADIAPESGRGQTMGLYSFTVGAGTVFAPLAGGELISRYGSSEGFAILFSIGIAIMGIVLIVRLQARKDV